MLVDSANLCVQELIGMRESRKSKHIVGRGEMLEWDNLGTNFTQSDHVLLLLSGLAGSHLFVCTKMG